MANFSCAFLSEDDKIKLNQVVTYEEKKARLWALKPFKAPGVDGLHDGFFQLFWNEVSELVCKEVGTIFSTRVVLEYLNKTLIALIPKSQTLSLSTTTSPLVCAIQFIKLSQRSSLLGLDLSLVAKSLQCKQPLFQGEEDWTISLLAKSLSSLLIRRRGKYGTWS